MLYTCLWFWLKQLPRVCHPWNQLYWAETPYGGQYVLPGTPFVGLLSLLLFLFCLLLPHYAILLLELLLHLLECLLLHCLQLIVRVISLRWQGLGPLVVGLWLRLSPVPLVSGLLLHSLSLSKAFCRCDPHGWSFSKACWAAWAFFSSQPCFLMGL